MRFILILMTILVTFKAQAKEDWFCTQESSGLVDEGEVKACGTAHSFDEGIAKAKALTEARREFWRLCMASDTCKGYPVSIIPGRTTCETRKGPKSDYIANEYDRYTCTRMVTFIVDTSARQCDPNGKERFKGCPMNEFPD